MSSIESDQGSASGSPEPIQLSIDGRSMRLYEIERTLELIIAKAKPPKASSSKKDKENEGNSLNLTSLGINTRITEDLIQLIRQTENWDSIALTNFMGDRSLCNDLLLACTTHPSVRSLAWRARIADAIESRLPRILVPTDFSTVNALLYGLKYGSHLTKLEATGLVLDVNMANLISRALVRNTTLLELTLNGSRFLSDNNGNARSNENHPGTKNSTVQTLSFGLRFNRTIESLSLDMCNDLQDEDIACLVNAVNSDGTVLRRLSLQETACFDQGMSSVAVLLQENVIEELNLSYLVRRRKKPPPKEEDTQQEDQQDDGEEDQTNKEEKASEEIVEPKSDEEEKEGDEAKQGNDTVDQDQAYEEKKDKQTLKDDKKNEAIKDDKKEEEAQQVQNTSLKVLSMAGNFLDDDYLESLLNIFPAQTHQSTSSNNEAPCSRLEELTLLGNRFSKHGIKELLKKLPRFPYLERLYLGYQRAPPPQRPTGLPPAILARMMTSNPSLSDQTTQFYPGSLKKEFVSAVSENPRNYRLTEVNVMALTNEDKEVEELLQHHMMLNAAGRKLLASNVEPNDVAIVTEDKTQSTVPLGLWPLVLDRANRLYPVVPSLSEDIDSNQDCEDELSALLDTEESRNESKVECDGFHAADVIFCLLHGPMVFENLDRRPLQS